MQKCNTNAIRVGEADVDSSPCLKLLGMTWDRHLSFKSHISVPCKAASFALFNQDPDASQQGERFETGHCPGVFTHGLLQQYVRGPPKGNAQILINVSKISRQK